MKRNRKISLDDLEKKEVFFTPDDYFERLPAAIQSRISAKNRSTGSFSLAWIKYSVSLASLVLLIVAGYFFYHSDASTEQPNTLLSEVSDEEIIYYLGQADVTQAELIETAATVNVSLDDDLLEDVEVTDDLLLYEVAPPVYQDTI